MSMVFSREELRDQLKRREIAPVYLLFGPETYFRDLAAKTITDLSFSEGDLRDFNETSFSLNTEDNLKRSLAAAEQLPMMAVRRVVRINDIRISATGYRDTITENHESLLSAYLTNPSPHSVVIFVADELNGVRKMGKFLREKTVAVEFGRLDDQELASWARKEVDEASAEIGDLDLKFLLARVGSDVRRLTNEIKKLAAAAMPGTRITAELITALVPNSRELSNFDLTDHLVAGRNAAGDASSGKDPRRWSGTVSPVGADFVQLSPAIDRKGNDDAVSFAGRDRVGGEAIWTWTRGFPGRCTPRGRQQANLRNSETFGHRSSDQNVDRGRRSSRNKNADRVARL